MTPDRSKSTLYVCVRVYVGMCDDTGSVCVHPVCMYVRMHSKDENAHISKQVETL